VSGFEGTIYSSFFALTNNIPITNRRERGVKSYIWQYSIGETPADEAEWVTAQVTSQASVELTGLTPLNKYWFRVAAVTIAGTTAYNAPLLQVVL